MADQNQSAGATPVAGGATPSQSQSSSSTGEPPTGYPDGLGDPGKRALDTMKAAKKAAEDDAAALRAELERIRGESQSEGEKAVTRARREAERETTAKYVTQIRRSAVRAALASAGTDPDLLDLAVKDEAFADLKVTDDGDVEGLDAAVAALRKARPRLFAKPGDFGGGNRGTTPPTTPTMNDAIRALARGGG